MTEPFVLNLDGYVALNFRLAPEARVQPHTARGIETFFFVFFGFRKILFTRSHEHVTSRTRAKSPARVLERNIVMDRDFEESFPILRIHGLVHRHESDFWHIGLRSSLRKFGGDFDDIKTHHFGDFIY